MKGVMVICAGVCLLPLLSLAWYSLPFSLVGIPIILIVLIILQWLRFSDG